MKRLLLLLLACGIGSAADPAVGQRWVELSATGPSGRHTPAAVYDPVQDRVILFGGRGAGGDLNDVWALDLGTHSWQQLSVAGEAPRPRFSHNAVYDGAHRRMLIWSGRALDASGSTLLNDVWALQLDELTWQRLDPVTPAPVARYGTAAVFDPVSAQLVTFAGFTTEGRFNDTWRFDPVQRRWLDVTSLSEQPGERCLHAAAYDGRRRRMIMFGGQRGNAALDDAWALDLSTNQWRALASAPATGGRKFPAVAGPAARDGAVLVYVAPRAQLILFGGTTPAGNADDTWMAQLEQSATAVTGSSSSSSADSSAFDLRVWPNPFNAHVVLDAQLIRGSELLIYDVLGHRVRSLGPQAPGAMRRVWDGRDDDGRAVASGVYLVHLSGQVRRLVLLR